MFSLECLLILLQELTRRYFNETNSSRSRYERGRDKYNRPGHRGNIFLGRFRTFRVFDYLKLKMRKQSLIDNTMGNNIKTLGEWKPSWILRNAHSGTLGMIILAWIVALSIGTTTLLLDIMSDEHSSNTLTSPEAISTPTSYCKNTYLEKLTGRYVISIIIVGILDHVFLIVTYYNHSLKYLINLDGDFEYAF